MDIVRDGYDRMVARYVADRSTLKTAPYVTKLLKRLKPHSSILDLGCGAGIPVDDILVRQGHAVIGIDISSEMIQRARRAVPGAEYTIRDISKLKTRDFEVDAVVSFYALFHIPRDQHLRILKTINSFLPVGGLILITMGDVDFEGTTTYLGHPMYWSQWGSGKNRALVEQAGFLVGIDHIDRSGGEAHQIILATKVKV